GVVLLAPLLGVGVVEPLVVAGDEVAPLDDLQGLLLRGRALGKEEVGPDPGGHRPRPRQLRELAPGQPPAVLPGHRFSAPSLRPAAPREPPSEARAAGRALLT